MPDQSAHSADPLRTPTPDEQLDTFAAAEALREDTEEARRPWGAAYSAEMIGWALTHWPELEEAHARRPHAAVDLIDLRAAVEAVLADPRAQVWADRNIMSGDECNPPKVTVVSVRSHRERDVYPPASEFRLEAEALGAQARAEPDYDRAKTLVEAAAVSATYNKAVRVFRKVREIANPGRERKPLRTTARYGGRCANPTCGQPIIIGQAIIVHNGAVSHADDS